ncbi:hypothetical protein, partial [Acetobacter fallax]|uniref:hypothetical protein n=1 Tax=Acetobacter fallax TaxID=1737473 RepID=UPI001A7E1CD8
CARVISVQAILISSGYRKPMNHNPLKSLNSFSVRHLGLASQDGLGRLPAVEVGSSVFMRDNLVFLTDQAA